MIIEKIIIKSFGLITDMTLEFSDTVNVIEGQNESGKSTIAAFIRYMLYGFDNDEPDDMPSERRRRINWETGAASGSMYVNVMGKRYLITRTTTPSEGGARASYREESSIVDLETGTPAFGKMPAGEVFFGVDRELFDNTAFIGQISDSGINEGSVRTSIENILFSGNERINTQRALNKVNDRMQTLMHPGASGGVIFDLMKKCDDYREKIEKSNEDNRKILVKEAELYEIRMKRDQAIHDREHFREIDSCYNNLMLIQTFDRLHELEEEAEHCADDYNRFVEENKKDGFVPSESYLADLAVAREMVNTDYRRLTEAEKNLEAQMGASGVTHETEGLIARCDSFGGEEKILSDAKRCFRGVLRSVMLGILGVLGLVAASVIEVLAFTERGGAVEKVLGGVLGAGSLALGIAMLITGVRSGKALRRLATAFGMRSYKDLVGKINHIAEARRSRDGMIAALESARATVEAARDGYAASKARLTETVNLWADGGEEPADLNEYLDSLENGVREFLAQKAELFAEKNKMELTVREIRRSLSDKSEIDVRAQVSPLKRKALAGVNHDEIINGIAENKAKIAEQDALAGSIENELALLKSNAGDLAEYHAKLGCLEQRTDELKMKHKAYFVAQDAINHAMENLRAEISPRLGEYATAMMGTMTGGKYTSFEVSDGLKVTFTATDGNNRSVDFLSGGTRDLAYVALRCALIDMLYREKPPVCFDESFAHQDNVRAKAMMKAIRQLSEEKCQSFIFTCRNREANLAKEAIPSAGIFKLSVVDADND